MFSQLNKLASLEATVVRNSAHPLTHSLTGVKCRATSVAKNQMEHYKLAKLGDLQSESETITTDPLTH